MLLTYTYFMWIRVMLGVRYMLFLCLVRWMFKFQRYCAAQSPVINFAFFHVRMLAIFEKEDGETSILI